MSGSSEHKPPTDESRWRSTPESPFILDDAARDALTRSTAARRRRSTQFVGLCCVVAGASMTILVALLTFIVYKGTAPFWPDGADFSSGINALAAHWSNFLQSPPDMRDASKAGFLPAIVGSLFVCGVCAVVALPLGVATAIFLEEFKPKLRVVRWFHGFVQLNITNLAGVPSVVYGIIGVAAFVYMFREIKGDPSPVFEMGLRDAYDQFKSDEFPARPLIVPLESALAPSTELAVGMTVLDSDGNPLEVNLIDPEAPSPSDPQLLRRTIRMEFPDTQGMTKEEQEAAVDDSTRWKPGVTRIVNRSWYYFRIPFGRSILACGLTLMLVVLPIVIISSQEALRAVPDSLREAALGLGSTRWQVVRRVTLPASIPGIMTGNILAMSRAIGETAPILMVLAVAHSHTIPKSPWDTAPVMPLQIFNWTGHYDNDFEKVAASGIIVLLIILLAINSIAVFIRQKFQKNLT